MIFAPAVDHPILSAQRTELEGRRDELDDRDIVVIEVIAADADIVHGEAAQLDAADLRRRYDVGTDESVVLLIGKDGGIKLRQSSAISTATLFATIDAMPMRQREMRERR